MTHGHTSRHAEKGQLGLCRAGSGADGAQVLQEALDASLGLAVSLTPSRVPFYPLLGEGSLTKIAYRKKGTVILICLLEDLALSSRTSNLWG